MKKDLYMKIKTKKTKVLVCSNKIQQNGDDNKIVCAFV